MLYVNANPTHLPAHPTAVATTDANGEYAFWGTTTASFTYVVTLVPLKGYQLTWDSTATGTYDGVHQSVVALYVTPPSVISGRVSSLLPQGSSTGTAGIAGVEVYLDTNGNGTLQPGDPFTYTNSNGDYRFSNLDPGMYRVVVVPPDGDDLASAATHNVAIIDQGDKVTDVDFELSRHDTPPPSAMISYPAATTEQAEDWLNQINGSVAAPHGAADVAKVRVSVQDQSTGDYWNGISFSSTSPVYLDAHGTSTWSLPLPVSALTGGHSYTIRSLAFDQEGDAQVAPTVRSFSYAAPEIDILPISPPTPLATSVSVTTSEALSVPGQPVTLTVRVAPPSGASSIPAGTVVLFDGASVLATVSLIDGTAAYQTAALAAGTHSIVAVYTGDARFQVGTSKPIIQSVQRAALQPSSTTGAQTLVIGGAGLCGNATITITRAVDLRHIRVIITETEGHRTRCVFSCLYKTKGLSQILIYEGGSAHPVHVGRSVRVPVVMG